MICFALTALSLVGVSTGEQPRHLQDWLVPPQALEQNLVNYPAGFSEPFPLPPSDGWPDIRHRGQAAAVLAVWNPSPVPRTIQASAYVGARIAFHPTGGFYLDQPAWSVDLTLEVEPFGTALRVVTVDYEKEAAVPPWGPFPVWPAEAYLTPYGYVQVYDGHVASLTAVYVGLQEVELLP